MSSTGVEPDFVLDVTPLSWSELITEYRILPGIGNQKSSETIK